MGFLDHRGGEHFPLSYFSWVEQDNGERIHVLPSRVWIRTPDAADGYTYRSIRPLANRIPCLCACIPATRSTRPTRWGGTRAVLAGGPSHRQVGWCDLHAAECRFVRRDVRSSRGSCQFA